MSSSFQPSATASTYEPSFRWLATTADRALAFLGVIMLLEIVKFIIAGNGDPPDPIGSGDPMARALWYPLYLGVILALAVRIGALMRLILPAWPIFALLAFTAASTTWSTAPDVTARRVVAVAFTVLFGLYLALREDRMETLRIIASAILFAALFNLGIIVAIPSEGVDQGLHAGAWKGLTVEKNALGGDMARASLLMLFLAFVDRRLRWLWTGGLALTTMLVLGSQSRTALLALLIPGGLFMLFLIARRSAAIATAVVYLGVTAVSAAALFVLTAPEQAAALIGKDMTLTGRTDIWSLSTQKIMAVPWTGYGQGAFWIDPYGPSYEILDQLQWVVPSAHNSWIEIGLGLGLPGLALLASAVGLSMLRSGIAILRGAPPFIFLGLLQLLMFSLSESSIFWYQNTFSCALFGFYATAALMPEPRIQNVPATIKPRPKLKSATGP